MAARNCDWIFGGILVSRIVGPISVLGCQDDRTVVECAGCWHVTTGYKRESTKKLVDLFQFLRRYPNLREHSHIDRLLSPHYIGPPPGSLRAQAEKRGSL